MSRLFSRAEIPIWNTQGFNPHPYMVFSAALPIGIEGENELLDIKLNGECSFPKMLERMNAEAPRGILFKEVYEADNSFSDIESALYILKLDSERIEAFRSFLSSDSIRVSKKTKRGEIDIDLKEYLKYKEENDAFELMLPCGNDLNLSPLLLTNAFSEKNGDDKAFVPEIRRICFYDKEGKKFR